MYSIAIDIAKTVKQLDRTWEVLRVEEERVDRMKLLQQQRQPRNQENADFVCALHTLELGTFQEINQLLD